MKKMDVVSIQESRRAYVTAVNTVDRTVCQGDPTASLLTETTLIYAVRAGITAAVGTRLVLQWITFWWRLSVIQLCIPY